jgi:RNA polymerase subunit RPABC4/transcription elongation factor Spt4
MFLAWPGGDWEATLKGVLVLFGVYLATLWLTLVFWTYRDIRHRSRDPVIQTVSVLLVLVFFLPGHWIYLILRPRYTLTELYERSLEEEALLQDLEDQKACPTCRRRVQDEFLVCPSCRTQLKEPCRACARPLSYAWIACPFCGMEKAPRESMAPRTGRPAPRTGAPVASGRPRPESAPQMTRPAPRDPAPAPRQAPATPRMLDDDGPVIDATAHGGAAT